MDSKNLNEQELEQVSGGFDSDYNIEWKKSGDEIETPSTPGTYHVEITIHDDGKSIWTSEQLP